ncbi:hypothetical protein GCM10022221_60180 [Actinocorallia aurea]
MIKVMGAGLAVCLALAGCSSDVPGARSSPKSFTGPPYGSRATATVTVAGKTVTVTPKPTGVAAEGRACQVEGFVGKNAAGRQVRCVKKTGETKTVWVVDTGANGDGTVRPGEPCPAEGAIGRSGGLNYTCVKVAGRNIWRPA